MSADKTQKSSGFDFWRSRNHNPWPWESRSFVSFDFLRQLQFWSHHPHKPSQLVDSQASLSVCLVQLSPRTTPFFGNTQNCSCSIMITNEDSLSYAACNRTDTIFSNFTKPNFLSLHCAIRFPHLRPVLLISLIFPSLPILILFMTFAAKRGSQQSDGLPSAIRTLVFCAAEIRRVLHCRFTFLTAISTRPLAMKSPSSGPGGITSTPTHA